MDKIEILHDILCINNVPHDEITEINYCENMFLFDSIGIDPDELPEICNKLSASGVTVLNIKSIPRIIMNQDIFLVVMKEVPFDEYKHDAKTA